MERKSFDTFWWGFVPGIFLPIFSVLLFYLYKSPNVSFLKFLENLMHYHIISKVIVLALLSNLIVFYLFLNNERYNSTRGVIGATLVYGFIILVYILIN